MAVGPSGSSTVMLIIRTDASTQIGIGHFMRCFALAQAWKDRGGQVLFITSCKIDSLLEKLKTEGFFLYQLDLPYPDKKDLDSTLQLLNSTGRDSWLVLDGYHFDSFYQRTVKEKGHHLLAIDDTAHLPMYWADLILSQNLGFEEIVYHRQPYSKLLLGSRYILMRREFTSWKNRERTISTTACKILITLGGGDTGNLSSKVMQVLQGADIPEMECQVLVGPANTHISSLKEIAKDSIFPVQLLINPSNVPEIMCWADLAIAAAGSVCWELAYLGVPGILLAPTPYHWQFITQLQQNNLFLGCKIDDLLGQVTRISRQREGREKLSRNCLSLFDGKGGIRICEMLSDERHD